MSIGPVRAQLVDDSGNAISGANRFFTQGTTGSTNFTPTYAFGFTSRNIVIKNDGSSALQFSFDGTNLHGQVEKTESFAFNDKSETRIALRSTTVGQTFRIFAW